MSMTPGQALSQASTTAAEYLRCAIRDIDEEFGEGYAVEHPELVGTIASIAASDFDLSFRMGQIELP